MVVAVVVAISPPGIEGWWRLEALRRCIYRVAPVAATAAAAGVVAAVAAAPLWGGKRRGLYLPHLLARSHEKDKCGRIPCVEAAEGFIDTSRAHFRVVDLTRSAVVLSQEKQT